MAVAEAQWNSLPQQIMMASMVPHRAALPLFLASVVVPGFSDYKWSFIVQITGLAIALVVGLLSRPGRLLMPSALALGILVNVVAEIFLGGGGPRAFVGFVVYPVLYYFAAVGGYGLKKLVGLIRRKATAADCTAPDRESPRL